MLEIKQLHAGYGGIAALNGISLKVDAGEFVSIVGPNGAGKTTMFKVISGSVVPRSGAITFNGEDLLAVPAHRRAHLGIAHVPEGRQVFPQLTVEENLEMGAYTEAGRKDWDSNIDYIFQLFPILRERRLQQAGTLSGGQQQMVAIGRGLASSPKLLMLDEPSMGLAPAVADSIFEAVVDIRRQRNLTVLLVEQRAVEALESCDRGYVIETGNVMLEGPQAELLSDDRVRQAYLGM
ncbi:ATP-binding cassette domain-containing protein [Rhizobium lusitanum]|uniref:ATP-binding cassette domain-containing protein n=1 Tax=Rhizobium lusitanum TaxID=293958 RepID=A0A6L9UB88_9HYPH|nr:ATP-binding cassette domain-containing protein [Rhizobium lusitanum]